MGKKRDSEEKGDVYSGGASLFPEHLQGALGMQESPSFMPMTRRTMHDDFLEFVMLFLFPIHWKFSIVKSKKKKKMQKKRPRKMAASMQILS